MGGEEQQVAGDGAALRLDVHDPVDDVDHECNGSSGTRTGNDVRAR